MNFQPFTCFCLVFYLISQYGVLCENDETQKIKEKFIEDMKARIKQCEEYIRILEREKTRKNVLIYKGQFDTSNPNHLEESIIQFMREQMGVHLKSEEIDYFKVIHKDDSNRPVILMGLTTWERKKEVMRKSNRLNGKVIITDDYPPNVLARRKKLIPEMHRLRSEGHYATVQYDQLITIEKDETKLEPKGNHLNSQEKTA